MKDFNAQSKNAYNRIADRYDDSFDGKFTEGFKLFLLEKIALEDGDFVLDIACGNGTLLNMMSKMKNIRGFGIDISDRMIKNAVARFEHIRFQVAGCEKIPLPDDSADTVTVCAAYHHFPDTAAFAREAERVLKAGGQLYIAEVYLPAIFRIACNPFVFLTGAGDVKFYSPGEIQKTFEPCGFTCQDVYRKGHIQILHFRKNS